MRARLLARIDDARCDFIARLLIRAGLITPVAPSPRRGFLMPRRQR